MAVEFLKKLKPRLAQKLHYSMHGYERARSHQHIHASDVTDTAFCPREFALLWYRAPEVKHRGNKRVSTSLRYTYDMGTMMADYLIHHWARDMVRGTWVCGHCKTQTPPFSPYPESCSICGHPHWEYAEAVINLFDNRFTFAVDVLMDLGEAKLRLVELKTIKDGDFKDLEGVSGNHKIRTAMYLEAMDRLGYSDKVFVDEAIVLYMCKGFGYKTPELASYGVQMDTTTPFKEFRVLREDHQEEVDMHFDTVEMLAGLGQQGEVGDNQLPPRISSCPAKGCPRAKGCKVSKLCWSLP